MMSIMNKRALLVVKLAMNQKVPKRPNVPCIFNLVVLFAGYIYNFTKQAFSLYIFPSNNLVR